MGGPERPTATSPDRLLLETVRAEWRWAVVAATAGLLAAAAVLLLPDAVGRALDAALARARSSGASAPAGLPEALISVAVLVLVIAVAGVLAQRAGTAGTAGATAWVRHRIVAALLALGLDGRRLYASGDAVSRITMGASTTGQILTLLVTAARTAITAVVALIALALIDWTLPVTLLVAVPVVVLLVRPFTRRATAASTDYQNAQGDIAARLVDALAGLRTIRASGTANRETDRVLEPLPALRSAGLESWTLQRRLAWSFGLLAPVLQIAMIAVAGWALSAGRISPGQLVAAVGYTGLALGALEKIDVVVNLARVRAGAGRVAELVQQTPPPAATGRLADGPGSVEFRDVCVRQDERLVLDRCTLRIPAGTTAAIVGPSGSGKSVLVGLLGRLTEPSSGTVLIDGDPVADLDDASLRAAVAYAFEQPVLLGDTIEDAITYAVRDAPGSAGMDEVLPAARAARADGFVRRLPDAYGTRLADAPLSGGEWQRLGLARAIAQQARVLVLDDATSSLDTATEREVTRALATVLPGRTRLIVAHRATTAASADVVAWLDAGRVRAVASHAELWTDPDYRALFAVELDPAP